MHVLVCDDDSATRLVVTRIVAHRFGCQVSECADGAAALQFISQQAVDLLLLDPRLNAAATAPQLNQLAPELQALGTELLAAPLAACSDNDLAQLRAWLNKPSANSLERSEEHTSELQSH